MENKINKLDKSLLKTYMNYLLPSVFGMLVIAAYIFTDTFVVGFALGRTGLSAIGIGTPITVALIALGYLFGEGGSAAYSILMGANDKKRAREIYTTSILLGLLTSIVFIIIGIVFIKPISYFLGASEENINYVIEYNKYIIWFSPAIMLNMSIGSFIRNDGKPKVAMIATTIGSLSNMVLDVLFVIVLNMGMAGASIATGLGSVITIIFNIGYCYIKKRNLQFAVFKVKFNDIKRIYKNGFGPFVMELSVAVINLIYNLVALKYYGELGVSAYTIVQNWNLIALDLIVGVGQATQPLISLNKGKGDLEKVKIFKNYGFISCLALGVVFLFTWIFGASSLASVFIVDDIQLLETSSYALKIVSATYIFLALTLMFGYYYLGIEKSRQSMIINVSRGFVFPLILVFIMPLLIGKVGIWVSIPLAEGLSALVAVVIYIATNYMEKHPRKNHLIEPPLNTIEKNDSVLQEQKQETKDVETEDTLEDKGETEPEPNSSVESIKEETLENKDSVEGSEISVEQPEVIEEK